MNYTLTLDNIINSCINREIDRNINYHIWYIKDFSEFTNKSDARKPDNIVRLTDKEYYVCTHLRSKFNSDYKKRYMQLSRCNK